MSFQVQWGINLRNFIEDLLVTSPSITVLSIIFCRDQGIEFLIKTFLLPKDFFVSQIFLGKLFNYQDMIDSKDCYEIWLTKRQPKQTSDKCNFRQSFHSRVETVHDTNDFLCNFFLLLILERLLLRAFIILKAKTGTSMKEHLEFQPFLWNSQALARYNRTRT